MVTSCSKKRSRDNTPARPLNGRRPRPRENPGPPKTCTCLGPSLCSEIVARLKRLSDGTSVPLAAQCLVGRSPSCGLVLEDRFVSSEHAKILWINGSWRLRDLGSRNGTFVDAQRLEPGQLAELQAGARIGFGEVEEAFELVDANPPSAMATDIESREVVAAEGEMLVLPDQDHPEVTVYHSNTAGWVAERATGEVQGVHDQSVVEVGARSFRIDLPVYSEATPMVDVVLNLDNAQLSFAVSSDEERVEIAVVLRGEERARLESREHNYLLLTLARARLADSERPVRERGWLEVEKILRMLKIDQNSLNVAIHRARQQLAGTGIEGAAAVVETRRGYRRLGTDRVTVVPLEEG